MGETERGARALAARRSVGIFIYDEARYSMWLSPSRCSRSRPGWRHPAVTVDTGRRWIDHGPVATSVGFSTGIDVALHLVARFESQELARATARQMDMPHPTSTREASAGRGVTGLSFGEQTSEETDQ